MKKALPVFIMIDACGWEIVKTDPLLGGIAPHRKRLESVFGYSSGCVPSILSGRWPSEHRNWCYFVYDPKNSPFRSLRSLRWLPQKLTSRRIIRRLLTKLVRHQLNFQGYFDLYNIPFKHIHLYDFSEKRSPLKPGGMNCGPNLSDYLEANRIAHFISDPARTEDEDQAALIETIEAKQIDFAFAYWPKLDGLLHRVGNTSPEVSEQLRRYEERIERVLAAAKKHYSEVWLHVFSDHGMANCDVLLDLKGEMEALEARFPQDYAVVYDSTMARFWFFNEKARQEISQRLSNLSQGRIVPDEELKKLGAFFPDRHFGELIFLVKEGVLIVPSHMGERPIRAMHGYHPSDPHSYAALISNQSIPSDITAIPHIFNLMTQKALLAKAANQAPPTPVS